MMVGNISLKKKENEQLIRVWCALKCKTTSVFLSELVDGWIKQNYKELNKVREMMR